MQPIENDPEPPNAMVRFNDGDLGIVLGLTEAEGTTVLDVEEGSQADYLSGGKSLIGAVITLISNSVCSRDIHTQDDFVNVVSELKRPIIVRIKATQEQRSCNYR